MIQMYNFLLKNFPPFTLNRQEGVPNATTKESVTRISLKPEFSSLNKFEEKLKNIDSFQKMISTQDLSSISSLISSISVESSTSSKHTEVQSQSSEILKSKLNKKPTSNSKVSKNLAAQQSVKCTNCSSITASSNSMSVIKPKKKKRNLILSKLNSIDAEDDQNENSETTNANDFPGNDDSYDTDENEDKDQMITIIMKQPKSSNDEPILETKLNSSKFKSSSSSLNHFHHSASLMLHKNDKNSILIKDMVKKLSCVDNTNNDDEDEDEYDEEDEYEEEDDEGDEDEYYDDEECNEDDADEEGCANSIPTSPLVEEFFKTMKNDEENIIFVQSLSSLAKKTLFNQQCQQQRKLLNRKQQQSIKDILIESNTIIHLGSSPSINNENTTKLMSGTCSQQQLNTSTSK